MDKNEKKLSVISRNIFVEQKTKKKNEKEKKRIKGWEKHKTSDEKKVSPFRTLK